MNEIVVAILIVCFVCFLSGSMLHGAASVAPRVVPFNTAEAVVEQFWDPDASQIGQWRQTLASGSGARIGQQWCWVTYEWARRNPLGEPEIVLERAWNLDVQPYDRLLLSIMIQAGATVRLHVETDRGPRDLQVPPGNAGRRELELDLAGASRIDRMTFSIQATQEGPGFGWINWIGLQNSAQLPAELARWRRTDTTWAGYLVPAEYKPRFEPKFGVAINAEEIEALRSKHAELLKAGGQSPFLATADKARKSAAERGAPERWISDFVNFNDETRYNRARDDGKELLGEKSPAVNLAIAGLVQKDPESLRLAARWALSIAMCGDWSDGMICRFPGSAYETRCFVRSICLHDVAMVMDLAGEMFTPHALNFLQRRLAEELGGVNFVTWKFDYIFDCNQVAWFSPGRMLAYCVLERSGWKRVDSYLDTAYRELTDNLDRTILPDGGYVEGPTYFGYCAGRSAGQALYYYSRARSKTFAQVAPMSLKQCGDFGALLESTDEGQDAIAFCDAKALMEIDGLSVMAALAPESRWPAMYQKHIARNHDAIGSLLSFQLHAPTKTPAARPAWVSLPELGAVASHRQTADGKWVKLAIWGNRAGAGHAHEDKGHFVLEYAGETLAMDPGTCDYSNPLSEAMQTCQRHSMLLPRGTKERPHPRSPCDQDVKPQGSGDARELHVKMDLTPAWAGYYRLWKRSWDSARAEELTITDEWALADTCAATGVSFLWQTKLPVKIDGRTVQIQGTKATAILTLPANATARVETLPLPDHGSQHCIVIDIEERRGALRMPVSLKPAS